MLFTVQNFRPIAWSCVNKSRFLEVALHSSNLQKLFSNASLKIAAFVNYFRDWLSLKNQQNTYFKWKIVPWSRYKFILNNFNIIFVKTKSIFLTTLECLFFCLLNYCKKSKTIFLITIEAVHDKNMLKMLKMLKDSLSQLVNVLILQNVISASVARKMIVLWSIVNHVGVSNIMHCTQGYSYHLFKWFSKSAPVGPQD